MMGRVEYCDVYCSRSTSTSSWHCKLERRKPLVNGMLLGLWGRKLVLWAGVVFRLVFGLGYIRGTRSNFAFWWF